MQEIDTLSYINRYIKKRNNGSKVVSPWSNTLFKLIEVWSCFSERFFKICWLNCEQYRKN